MSDLPPPPPEFEPGSSSQPPPPPDPSLHSPQAMTGWATLGTGERVELASPGARLGARVLDAVIMIVAIIIISLVGIGSAIGLASDDEASAGLSFGAILLTAFLSAVIGVAYEVTMIALKGQTVGKMATNVKVVRADNGLLPGWGKSIGRWIIPALLAFVPFIGWILALLVYISLTWDRARQGWHDKTAGTIVVKT